MGASARLSSLAEGHLDYPQSTLEEIIESERRLVLDGEARYGNHYIHARAATVYLSRCVVSIERDRADTFGRLLALMKKQHLLAYLSALRLHHVQAMMDLRQVLEAGAAAAYAIANPAVEDFVDIDEFGILDPSQKLLKRRYDWINEKYSAKSEWIKETKDRINSQTAHANIILGHNSFRLVGTEATARTPFFDIEDKDYVKVDMWLISSVAITLMDFFFGVETEVARAGRSVVEFRTDFQRTIQGLAAESNRLLDEMKASDRYKAARQKQAERARTKPE
jgi:hypothetical protein